MKKFILFFQNTKLKNFYHNLYTIPSYTVFIVIEEK